VFKITEDGGASCQRRPAFFHCKFCQRRMYSIVLLLSKNEKQRMNQIPIPAITEHTCSTNSVASGV
jgi:hypothetical protein